MTMKLWTGVGFAFLLPLVSLWAAAAEYPTLVYYVTDQMDVLASYEEYDLEDICVEVYEQTGAEMAILIVNTTLPDGIDIFAVETFEQNGLGQEGKDDGLLILVSVAESAWRIEVGYGLEGILPDSKVGDIGTTYLNPNLTAGDYYSGLYGTAYAIGVEIINNYEGTPQVSKSPYPISWIPLKTWQLILVIGVVAGLAIITRGRVFLPLLLFFRNRGGGGKSWGGGRSGGGGARGKW